MTKFVLVYAGGGYPESEAQQAEVMAAWGAWYQDLGQAIVDGGNPFGAAKNVTSTAPFRNSGVLRAIMTTANESTNAAAR